jgi:hypothetical protein
MRASPLHFGCVHALRRRQLVCAARDVRGRRPRPRAARHHVRRDARVWVQPKWISFMSCSSRRPRTPPFQGGYAGSSPAHDASTRSLRRAHASEAEIGRKDRAAPEPVTGWSFFSCLVNSAARVPACLAGSRGFNSRTRRQIKFAEIAQRVERRVEGACVGGSEPSLGTSEQNLVSSDGSRAPAYEAGGRTFESCTRCQSIPR